MRRTSLERRLASAILVALSVTAGPICTRLAAAQYTAVDVHPAGYASSQIRAASDDGTQQAGFAGSNTNPIPMTWSGSAASALVLGPPGMALLGADGTQQVGGDVVPARVPYQSLSVFENTRATLWSGSSAGTLDLHPIGFGNSIATDVHSGTQVGYGVPTASNGEHALLWSGSAASAVDLNPPGYLQSVALAVHGEMQGGSGYVNGVREQHALLWSGTPESAINLQPAGHGRSELLGLSAGQQVGYARAPDAGGLGAPHAVLWLSTAASAADLHPGAPFFVSVAEDTNGRQQVGQGLLTDGSGARALLWSGTAASVVNLHDFLSAEYVSSAAFAIDDAGNVYGFAHHGPTGADHAMIWAVPEPGGLAIVALAVTVWSGRRRRPA